MAKCEYAYIRRGYNLGNMYPAGTLGLLLRMGILDTAKIFRRGMRP